MYGGQSLSHQSGWRIIQKRPRHIRARAAVYVLTSPVFLPLVLFVEFSYENSLTSAQLATVTLSWMHFQWFLIATICICTSSVIHRSCCTSLAEWPNIARPFGKDQPEKNFFKKKSTRWAGTWTTIVWTMFRDWANSLKLVRRLDYRNGTRTSAKALAASEKKTFSSIGY